MTHLEMLVKSHQAKAASSSEGSKRKAKWLDELGRLIQGVQDALLAAGVPADHIHVVDYSINEETLGHYRAPGLTVTIGNSELVFAPKGSFIIGGYGRVDVTGPQGRVKLIADAVDNDEAVDIRADWDREWQWSVYPDWGRRGCFSFDEDGLAKVLEQVMGAS